MKCNSDCANYSVLGKAHGHCLRYFIKEHENKKVELNQECIFDKPEKEENIMTIIK